MQRNLNKLEKNGKRMIEQGVIQASLPCENISRVIHSHKQLSSSKFRIFIHPEAQIFETVSKWKHNTEYKPSIN